MYVLAILRERRKLKWEIQSCGDAFLVVFFFFVLRNFVKNFTEIELHPPNIWFSLMLLLPTEDGPVQNFPPALLRTCLGSAAHVDAEPALRNLRTNAGRAWTSNRDPRRKHY